MKFDHDKAHDAAYFQISRRSSTRQVKLDNARIVDYASDGSVVGVEFISPSLGIDLTDLPHASEIEKAAKKAGLLIRPSRAPSAGQPT